MYEMINFLEHGHYISALEHVMKLIFYNYVVLASRNKLHVCKYCYIYYINYPLHDNINYSYRTIAGPLKSDSIVTNCYVKCTKFLFLIPNIIQS